MDTTIPCENTLSRGEWRSEVYQGGQGTSALPPGSSCIHLLQHHLETCRHFVLWTFMFIYYSVIFEFWIHYEFRILILCDITTGLWLWKSFLMVTRRALLCHNKFTNLNTLNILQFCFHCMLTYMLIVYHVTWPCWNNYIFPKGYVGFSNLYIWDCNEC